ncbi:MAG: 2,3-bisphosphoglycerate-independent phosphoglycerate mutase [Alphaproteobacteria bacterium MarineAlpha2_Bin1]|nr:MAG: 2,3-bisphosphoglycerate-independent phosphoglycerate mutase [Alphaproteobacteria bacterium MarineAlpha2_Bin1]
MKKINQKIILCILDGWGHSNTSLNNAIYSANTKTYDSLLRNYPNSLLKTSGFDVGLPDGQMGNSEVGHLNLGSGRIIKQDLVKIDESINNKQLANNHVIKNLINKLKNNNKKCHLIGLMSPGGVHSKQNHILELAKILSQDKIETNIHAILDGRDTPPKSAFDYLGDFISKMPKLSKIASISGRYYAMDRDNRWERTKLYYETILNINSKKFESGLDIIKNFYDNEIFDEFIPPSSDIKYQGIDNGDGLLVANFRADRVRQILSALIIDEFNNFDRKLKPDFCSKNIMTSYSSEIDEHCNIIFPPNDIIDTLGEIFDKNNLKQFRIAETEKYAHVTFFFNGGREKPFKLEERVLVPSPKVDTYDQKPEMSAYEVTDNLLEAIKRDNNDLIIVNYANPDMVGHTGNLNAAISAVEVIDDCLKRIVNKAKETNSILIITADHGNVECMQNNENKQPHTAHTTKDVPLIIVNAKNIQSLSNGRLCDVSPTILDLCGIEKPSLMTGKTLINQ